MDTKQQQEQTTPLVSIDCNIESIGIRSDHQSIATPDSSSTIATKQLIDGVLKANIHIPITMTNRKLLLIVLVDKSRSIQSAWTQIQYTLINLISMATNVNQEVIVEILFFNNTCYQLKWNLDNYKELILAEKPNGKTCFASCFDLCSDVIRSYFKLNSVFASDRGYNPNTDTAIVMLTDGSHTSARDHKKAFANLRDIIDRVPSPVAVHTIGFTANSRFKDLDGIRRLLGNKEGVYQYAESTEGPHALKEKLKTIFTYVLSSNDTMEVKITLSSDDGLESPVFIEGLSNVSKPETIVIDRDGFSELTLGLMMDRPMKSVNVKFLFKSGKDKIFDRQTLSITPKILDDNYFKMFMSLTRLEAQLKSFLETVRSKSAETEPTEEVKSQYLKSILGLQKEINDFDNKVIFSLPSSQRGEIVAIKSSCMNISSQLLEIISGWVRNEWSSSGARLADITYQFMFKNAGRQRRVSQRIARNSAAMQNDTKNQSKVEASTDCFDEIEDPKQTELLEQSKSLFACILSLSDWVEMIEEKDVMGFGLSVQRPETVIDEPTQLRIMDVSSSFMAKSSIEDAISLAVDVHGHDKITGGFEVGYNNGEKAAFVKGRGREPINSWLPLYLHEEHWKSARYQLRNILAYFVTLDPLVFSYGQVDTVFLVLGTMISRDDIGERQLQLLCQLIRTASEIVKDLKYEKRIEQQITQFLHNPVYQVSEQPKNLLVLLSYLLVLPNQDLKRIFDTDSKWVRFWNNILEATIRRGCYSFFTQKEQSIIDSYLIDILYGERDTPVDSVNLDDLMDKLFNYEYSKIKFDEQDYIKLLDIKPISLVSDDPHRVNYMDLKSNQINPIIRLSNLLESKGYPNVPSLLNCLRFVHTWRTQIMKDETDAFKVLDDRFGVAPIEWIDLIKKGINPKENTSLETKNCGFGVYLSTVNQLYGKLNSNAKILQQLRSMIVQSVTYRINRHANEAVEAGIYTDSFTDPERCITAVKLHVVCRIESIIKKREMELHFSKVTSSAIKSGDMETFINTIPQIRNHMFKPYILTWCNNSLQKTVPYATEKFIVFLSNIQIVLDNQGNSFYRKLHNTTWNFGKEYGNKFKKNWSNFSFIENSVDHVKYLCENQNREEYEDDNY
eukprot:gene5277-6570_t